MKSQNWKLKLRTGSRNSTTDYGQQQTTLITQTKYIHNLQNASERRHVPRWKWLLAFKTSATFSLALYTNFQPATLLYSKISHVTLTCTTIPDFSIGSIESGIFGMGLFVIIEARFLRAKIRSDAFIHAQAASLETTEATVEKRRWLTSKDPSSVVISWHHDIKGVNRKMKIRYSDSVEKRVHQLQIFLLPSVSIRAIPKNG